MFGREVFQCFVDHLPVFALDELPVRLAAHVLAALIACPHVFTSPPSVAVLPPVLLKVSVLIQVVSGWDVASHNQIPRFAEPIRIKSIRGEAEIRQKMLRKR